MTGAVKRSKLVVFVGFLWIIQSVGRLCFAAVGTPGGMGQFLDTPISNEVSVILFVMFMFLGILGLVAAFGLLAGRKWGFWSTILASVATIAFDIWGLTIQLTASIGLIVPIISIGILYFKKEQMLATVK
ncbi:MAG: hypothetical protein QXJ31_04855 [Candidatus Bathyarchaeia archaeon]